VTLVALALVAALIVVCVSFVGALERQRRAHARREELLVNQVMHLSGKSWTPPPAERWTAPAGDDPLVAEIGEWTATPEQQPLYG
jgi:hypothetical protein